MFDDLFNLTLFLADILENKKVKKRRKLALFDLHKKLKWIKTKMFFYLLFLILLA